MSYLIAKFGITMLICAFSASFLRPELSIVLAVCSVFGFFGFFFSGKNLREFSALFAAVGISAPQRQGKGSHQRRGNKQKHQGNAADAFLLIVFG